MLLYHSTSHKGKAGIEAEGFAVSHGKDCPQGAWLSASRPSKPWHVVPTGWRDWWVIVELPDDVAEQHHFLLKDGTPYEDHYCIPWDVINKYRPFTYELWAS